MPAGAAGRSPACRILIYHTYALYSMSETQFYTPPIPEPAKASEGRFIPNRMEDGAVMRRVSRDLYASETAGVREILANEITAARAARKLGADPRIHVTVKRDKIVVWGNNSLGMERAIFDDVFTVLGRSGNFDGTTPGQFGFGRAAYVTVSDTMLLETRHRNGDRYAVRGIDGAGFEVGLPEPDIPYGTRVTLAPRDGCNMSALENMVRAAARRCEIPITITTVNGFEVLKPEPLSGPGSLIHIDLPDLECAVMSVQGNTGQSYLCGMPISFRYRGDHSVYVAVDIRDERKYPPTPDRERMTEAAERAISDIIDREIGNRLAGFPADINGALAHPDRRIAYEMHVGPLEMHEMVTVYDGGGPHMQYLGSVDASPVLACRTFSKRHIGAVLERHPRAEFVKNAPPGLHTMQDFMKEHGIRLPPPERRPVGDVAVHTLNGVRRIDPADPPAGLDIYRVANGRVLNHEKFRLYYLPARGGDAALTIHDVRGAVDIGELEAEARGNSFTTSRGVMTGGELVDCHARIMRSARRAIVDSWEAGMPDSGAIVVWDDGTPGHAEAYRLLRWLADRRVVDWVSIGEMNKCGRLVETYLRLGNPALRMALREYPAVHSARFCDGFLALEGKEPAAPDGDCSHCGSG